MSTFRIKKFEQILYMVVYVLFTVSIAAAQSGTAPEAPSSASPIMSIRSLDAPGSTGNFQDIRSISYSESTVTPDATATPEIAVSPVPAVESVLQGQSVQGQSVQGRKAVVSQVSPAVGNFADYMQQDQKIGPFEVIDQNDENKISVVLRRSRIMRTQFDIRRTSIIDPTVCDLIQFTPREFAVVGKKLGTTQITFWFEDGSHRPVSFLIRTTPDPDVQNNLEKQYKEFEAKINKYFPNSKIVLTILANKLIIRGQAWDAVEASQIMSVIRSGPTRANNYTGSFTEGPAAALINNEDTSQPTPSLELVNMLTIPGVQTVALKVKMANLNRSMARGIGVDVSLSVNDGKFFLQSMVDAFTSSSSNGGMSASLLNNSVLGGTYTFSNGAVSWGINYLESRGVVRVLSEPTLVTTSGKTATLVAGGEFAVPTTVGVGGASAVSTSFRAYGAIVSFLPVVLDKDLIRMDISPEFSAIDQSTSNNGTPGLTTRSITTTVEMREGQTLAIGGLIDTAMRGESSGDLPWLSTVMGKRGTTATETELLILVTPELILPLEPEAVPPLPGFDVTEPTNGEFFLGGRLEGTPTREHRSTVWPYLRNRYTHGGSDIMSGPYGHSGTATASGPCPQ